MNMFSSIKSVLGLVEAEELPGHIKITGISGGILQKQLEKIYGTRIISGMFSQFGWSAVTIPKFFAYDFKVTIESLLDNPNTRINPGMLRKILKALEELPIFRRANTPVHSKLNYKKLELFRYDPLPHQEEFLKTYDSCTQRFGLNGYILASPAGTGKSGMGVFLSEMLGYKQTIIFSPTNALERVWEATLHDFFKETPSYYVYGKGTMRGDEKYIIFSHDNVKYALEMIKKYIRPGSCNIVIDECHAFNEMKSNRSQLLIDAHKYLSCKDSLFMSGTPFKALGAEVLPYLWSCDPLFNKFNEERFKKIFGVSGNKALDILSARIGRSTYTVEKKTVVNNTRYNIEMKVKIPNGKDYTMESIRKKMEIFIKERVDYYKLVGPNMEREYHQLVELYEKSCNNTAERAALQVYKQNALKIKHTEDLRAISDLINQVNVYENKTIIPNLPSNLRQRFRETRSVYKYVPLKIQGEALGRILGKEREQCNVEVLKGLDNARVWCPELGWNGEQFSIGDIFNQSKAKTIFFTDYVEVVKEAGKMFTEAGMKPLLVYADTNKDLASIIAQVEKDPQSNPLVATYKSLSTAVPLVMMDSCVLLSTPFRDHIYNQATSRLDRLGQKHELYFYHVYLDTGEESNISTRSKDIMEWSKQMVSVLMGGKLPDSPDIIGAEMEDNLVATEKPTQGYQAKGYMKW